tara:strand:- start:61330 stop:62241 length:912 start_codon:yes stop_codon:yes gene_type:complete
MYRSIITLTLTLYSGLILAQISDYELINFSNNRLRTIDEILIETQKSRSELVAYECSAADRYELFSKRIFQNSQGSSLKIKDSKGNLYTYMGDTILDSRGRTPRRVRDKFLKLALNALERIKSVKEGAALINELQHSPYEFVIMRGGNRYDPSDEGQRSYTHGNEAGLISMLDELQPIVDGFPFQKIGHGGRIYWEPSTNASFIESDYQERKVDTDIILAHEMYHAYDGMRGLLDRRFVKGDELEFQPVAEYRAVRMENIMRDGLGYKLRRFYSKPSDLSSIKDMLNDYEEPIKLPTPCIEWL